MGRGAAVGGLRDKKNLVTVVIEITEGLCLAVRGERRVESNPGIGVAKLALQVGNVWRICHVREGFSAT
jgi:hypothetical protein